MKYKLTLLLVTILALTSCKDEKKSGSVKDTAVVEANSDKSVFKVSFDLIIKKDDNLHLYYTEDETINFNEKMSIWMPVKGSENAQTVTFKLPEAASPTHIRVDFGFGKNESQSDVELKTFKMDYYGQQVVANGTSIFDYFYPNKDNTEIVSGTSILKRLKKDQESGPMLYPQIQLSKKIKEMTLGTGAK